MNRGARKILVLTAVIVLALSGCMGGGASDGTSLAETKSPAQLLRNEIASRLPADIVTGVQETDLSESCAADGLVRSWRSTAAVAIAPRSAAELKGIADDLVGSLVDQGWEASKRDASSRLFEYRLTRDSSSADVHITADAGDDDGSNPSMLIVVNGPCVVTDGPDSDEVRELENRQK